MQLHLKYSLLIHQNDIQKHIKLRIEKHYLLNSFQNHLNGIRLNKKQEQLVGLHNCH